jgi:hypothetical protein
MEETSIESAVRHGREGAESMLERLTSELAEETEHPPASNEGFFALSKRIGEAFSHQAERAAALDGVTDALSVWSALPRGGLVGFRAKNHPQQVGTNGADDDDAFGGGSTTPRSHMTRLRARDTVSPSYIKATARRVSALLPMYS